MRNSWIVLLVFVVLTVVTVHSVDLSGKIVDGTGCDRVSLNHGERYAFCKFDGSFSFHDVRISFLRFHTYTSLQLDIHTTFMYRVILYV